ncbi:helix-turn-helix domain-containing protein [Vibrio diazotrophicus]|uniref:helix-turn-helix domain-containing protein n=1 Tax=Vibrio diazotrophicus TaxID=685 RepID=UPI000C9E43A5|nr:helix-turn-helix domain-containing protein [Vibrio diazotrophicus]PNH81273.1 hypothetical protein C1N27_06945 [Vibrio diazotrophicus]
MLHLTSEEYVGEHSNIRVVERSPQSDFPEHCHNFSELVLVSSGHGMHVVNGEQALLFPNTIACISSRDYHSFYDNKDVMLLNVMYNKEDLMFSRQAVDVIKKLEIDGAGGIVTEKSFRNVYAIAETIKNEYSLNDPYSKQMQSLLFEQLVLMMGRLYFEKFQHSPVMNALIYLCNNFRDQNVSVTHVCNLFSVTQKSLSSKVSGLTGLSTNKFLNLLRIREAKLLLRRGLSVTEVAHLTGYSDSNYFSAKFKTVTGVSPREHVKFYG